MLPCLSAPPGLAWHKDGGGTVCCWASAAHPGSGGGGPGRPLFQQASCRAASHHRVVGVRGLVAEGALQERSRPCPLVTYPMPRAAHLSHGRAVLSKYGRMFQSAFSLLWLKDLTRTILGRKLLWGLRVPGVSVYRQLAPFLRA